MANETEKKGKQPMGDHDRVSMASRLPDGTPHQTPDFEFIGPKDGVLAAAEEQLKQQRVSAADVAARGVEAGSGVLAEDDEDPKAGIINPSNAPQDPSIAKLQDIHEAAAEAGKGQAEAEVNEHHKGLGDPEAEAEDK